MDEETANYEGHCLRIRARKAVFHNLRDMIWGTNRNRKVRKQSRPIPSWIPAPSLALKQSTLRAGPHAGGDDARTARERGYKPRPQEPLSLRDQVCLEITSLGERDSL